MICVKVRKDSPVPPTSWGPQHGVIPNKKNQTHNSWKNRWRKGKKETISEYTKVVALPPPPAPALPTLPSEPVGILLLPPLQLLPPWPADHIPAPLPALQPLQWSGWTGVHGVPLLTPGPDGLVPAGCEAVALTAPATILLLLPSPLPVCTCQVSWSPWAPLTPPSSVPLASPILETTPPMKFPCLTTAQAPRSTTTTSPASAPRATIQATA